MPETVQRAGTYSARIGEAGDLSASGMQDEIAESGPRPTARASVADRHVGNRIRERRVMLGLSQQQLAGMIGVTYQQAHKYERGLNRISAGRLYEIAEVLNVPVSWFFEGLTADPRPIEMTPRQRMCLELARNFSAIDNEKHQEALSQMARALAAESHHDRSIER